MSVNIRTTFFTIVFLFLIVLASFPGVFDWSNRITPLVFGIPFSYFWQILLNILMFIVLIVWYLVESKSGDLDIDIEEDAE